MKQCGSCGGFCGKTCEQKRVLPQDWAVESMQKARDRLSLALIGHTIPDPEMEDKAREQIRQLREMMRWWK